MLQKQILNKNFHIFFYITFLLFCQYIQINLAQITNIPFLVLFLAFLILFRNNIIPAVVNIIPTISNHTG
jgi:hypothetical protein